MNLPPHDPLPDFSALLRRALDDLDPGARTFLQMLSDDAVMEFPYAPAGMTQRLEGRAAIAEYLGALTDVLMIESLSAPVVHRLVQPGVTILEFTGVGQSVRSGKSYDQSYISVITVRGGHIVHYRDYWNPLAAVEAMAPDSGTAAGGEG